VLRQNIESEIWFLLVNYDKAWEDRNNPKNKLLLLKTELIGNVPVHGFTRLQNKTMFYSHLLHEAKESQSEKWS
jgi:hypothetical protein